MHDLLPTLSGYLSGILADLPFFKPETHLVILFVLIIVTDLVFGSSSARLCRIIAFAGLLFVALGDWLQLGLLMVKFNGEGHFLFSQMLLLTPPAIKMKVVVDLLAFILVIYFEWDEELNSHSKGLSDLYSIVVGSVFGLHLMIMAVNLLSVYVAIELVSIASYLMVAYRAENAYTAEAGLKYVLFGAAASAVMLFGMSLLYAFTGTLNLFSSDFIPALLHVNKAAAAIAIILVLTGIGFKLSFVPTHFWVPDVYEGAATPVTAWLSTLPKIAGFALLVNFLTPFIFFGKWTGLDFRLVLSIIAIVTMIAGNFAAVLQTNIKRMLAYSSIGHTGFALLAVVTFNGSGISALVYYLTVYGIANIGALILASYFINLAEASDLESYRGLGLKYPTASVCYVVALISLAGLPVTGGFTGKLFVFSSVYGVYQQGHNTWLLLLMITGAVTTVVSLFYYIKIPLYLFLKRSENMIEPVRKSYGILILSVIISLVIILLGIFPNLIYSTT
jgi:NADH-quinone oxidoreductase subunit N